MQQILLKKPQHAHIKATVSPHHERTISRNTPKYTSIPHRAAVITHTEESPLPSGRLQSLWSASRGSSSVNEHNTLPSGQEVSYS
ncbi:hypothetical protein CesoFtcFv8_012045 [Champsocephalus esox]|uniref:Uncharacterized protein n=1 Tax=Champsocephalus esox TaxID=159716 RepID=A0AAN8C5F5_9TELE|nr:hypothetical protein CesoFtcFv8_012045 [Champsocephalus esox]